MYDEQPIYQNPSLGDNTFGTGEQMPPQPDPVNETFNQTSSETPLQRFISHQRRAAEEAGKALGALIPPGVREHGEEAKKEFLAGFKVLIDSAATSIETELNRVRTQAQNARAAAESAVNDAGTDHPGNPSNTGKTKVKIEVN